MAVAGAASGGVEPGTQQYQQQQRRRQRPQFGDRVQAGQQLARGLGEYADGTAVVVSVGRGGAVVAAAVAAALGRGVPHLHYRVEAIPCAQLPRLSLGSVAGDGSVRIDAMVAGSLGVDAGAPDAATMRAIRAIDRRLRRAQDAFCRAPPGARELDGRTVIVVDDGIEAGDTMREAVLHLRHCFAPRQVVVAAPVCLADARKHLRRHADAVVDVVSPLSVGSVAQWYAGGAQPTPAEQRVLARLFAGPQRCQPWAPEARVAPSPPGTPRASPHPGPQ
ncbi:hypothetical protein H4R18_002055 [Coemansia javaensis]|uniref:Phosphoribosyltransferase domain-containing protein n=1 Tax=Coemansia javaensis TaxID=2761396 RepID=A0A9W8HHW5_9FUNG|nr:hypothetical protein H4R18_002055 [Coemansia javaensis]